jgi:iron complex transport system ATP-binding protein
LRDLADKDGLTALMAMHDLNQVSGIVDCVALLKNGSMMALGAPDEVLTPDNILTAYQAKVETFTHPGTMRHLVLPLNK